MVHYFSEFLSDLLEYVEPPSGLFLPEQLYRRIPGAVVSVEHPPPIRGGANQGPCGLAHGCCEMKDTSIDGDDQVEIGYCGGGVGEIVKVAGEVNNRQTRLRVARYGGRRIVGAGVLQLVGGLVSLKRVQRQALDACQRSEVEESAGAKVVFLVGRCTSPDYAEAEGVRRHSVLPTCGRGWIAEDVRRLSGYVVESRVEKARQVHQRAMKIERG